MTSLFPGVGARTTARLTARGREALGGATAEHLDASAQWFGRITPDEQRELNRLLKGVLAS